jgi:hypothetical protein
MKFHFLNSRNNHVHLANFYSRQVMGYWVVVVKGISLLQMASDAPNVKFSEGKLAIQRQRDQLLAQEKVFNSAIGESTVQMAELLLSNPGSPIPIALSNYRRLGLCRVYIKDVLQFVTKESKTKFWLEAPPVFPVKLGSDSRYPLHVREEGNNFYVGPIPATMHMDSGMVGDSSEEHSNWYIKPVSLGSDRYKFEYESNKPGSKKHLSMKLSFSPSFDEDLRLQYVPDSGAEECQFYVGPWLD